MLTSTRLIMIFLLSFVYYNLVPNGSQWLKYYVIVATILFILNHILLFLEKFKKWSLVYILIDCILSFLYGILFPSITLYLIFFGVIAVTLFLSISDKRILKISSYVFLIIWGIVAFSWWKQTGRIEILENVISGSFVVFGAVVGNLIRKLLEARETMDRQFEQLQSSHQALSEAHDQLQNYSKQVEELTTIRERNRIAREIHDTVGHKMTALLVQMELSKVLLKLDLPKAEETIEVCENLARDALQEIRLSVRTLHQEEEEHVAFIPAIRKLLADFFETTNLESVFELSGDPTIIPNYLQPIMIRTIQESLTNAKRHGGATSFLLKMNCSEEAITMITKDNGKGVHLIEPGFGLINIKERIEEHGGSVFFESFVGEGFQMNVLFPLLQKTWRTGGRND
ncbi:sensor histidine kinase [Pseudoneobacillus rhizosphaerae]|uniref:histidine kinase n=1 Tax=Pseudoneobacillus rhizosphaerae TaxID=2880968 RepID=A0A9C7L9M7_9BACI|nr:sensor histidine kinase [Pseudoneobacillus rhizosphaerae]CAG9607008.1 Sensor histidine kinase LnrJ [Pseudoneobacillus rhizosphaerae]